MVLSKLPFDISANDFDENGLVILSEFSKKRMVPAYVASELGFNVPGKEFLERFYSRLRAAHVMPLCPFKACGEYLDSEILNNTKQIIDLEFFWDDFNGIVGPVNYGQLMPHSKMIIAILDGSHHVDDGVSAEIGHYATKYPDNPIIGIRSDFRISENISAPINPAVRYFIDSDPNRGQLFTGPTAYEDALKVIEKMASDIIVSKGMEVPAARKVI